MKKELEDEINKTEDAIHLLKTGRKDLSENERSSMINNNNWYLDGLKFAYNLLAK